MIMIFVKATITYFWLKYKIYFKKLAVMKNNKLMLIYGFVNISPIIF